MAISNTINNGILTLITKGTSLTTSYTNIYIGLLTTLPSDASCMSGDDKDWEEVDATYGGVSTGYGRYRMAYSNNGNKNYSQGAHGRAIIQTAPHWDANDKACIVVNDGDDMMFPNIVETLSPSKSWDVIGFGIFSAETGGEMIAYGKLVDDEGDPATVTLRAGSVPIFYQDSFKLMLKDGEDGEAEA